VEKVVAFITLLQVIFYYNCVDNITKVEIFTTSTFTSNSAERAGGGIYWDYVAITSWDKITNSGNSATLYGADKACFAQKLIRIEESDYTSNQLRRYLTSSVSGTTSVSVTNQTSGGTLPNIYLALVDEFNQYVKSDSASTSTISITSSVIGQTYTPTLSGTLTITASKGMFAFSSLTFTAEPGQIFSKFHYLTKV
jgi:predicted outer membrane repeat protein